MNRLVLPILVTAAAGLGLVLASRSSSAPAPAPKPAPGPAPGPSNLPPALQQAFDALMASAEADPAGPEKLDALAAQLDALGFTAEALRLRLRANEIRAARQRVSASAPQHFRERGRGPRIGPAIPGGGGEVVTTSALPSSEGAVPSRLTDAQARMVAAMLDPRNSPEPAWIDNVIRDISGPDGSWFPNEVFALQARKRQLSLLKT